MKDYTVSITIGGVIKADEDSINEQIDKLVEAAEDATGLHELEYEVNV